METNGFCCRSYFLSSDQQVNILFVVDATHSDPNFFVTNTRSMRRVTTLTKTVVLAKTMTNKFNSYCLLIYWNFILTNIHPLSWSSPYWFLHIIVETAQPIGTFKLFNTFRPALVLVPTGLSRHQSGVGTSTKPIFISLLKKKYWA